MNKWGDVVQHEIRNQAIDYCVCYQFLCGGCSQNADPGGADPLTGLIVLIWLYLDHPGDFALMTAYTKGVLWGIVPTILFFLMAFVCFGKHLPLGVVLCASFAVWLVAAFVHQWLLR